MESLELSSIRVRGIRRALRQASPTLLDELVLEKGSVFWVGCVPAYPPERAAEFIELARRHQLAAMARYDEFIATEDNLCAFLIRMRPPAAGYRLIVICDYAKPCDEARFVVDEAIEGIAVMPRAGQEPSGAVRFHDRVRSRRPRPPAEASSNWSWFVFACEALLWLSCIGS